MWIKPKQSIIGRWVHVGGGKVIQFGCNTKWKYVSKGDSELVPAFNILEVNK